MHRRPQRQRYSFPGPNPDVSKTVWLPVPRSGAQCHVQVRRCTVPLAVLFEANPCVILNVCRCGRLAQLGERRVRNAEVGSSSLLPSTSLRSGAGRRLPTEAQRAKAGRSLPPRATAGKPVSPSAGRRLPAEAQRQGGPLIAAESYGWQAREPECRAKAACRAATREGGPIIAAEATGRLTSRSSREDAGMAHADEAARSLGSSASTRLA